jgi:hypothetical protein
MIAAVYARKSTEQIGAGVSPFPILLLAIRRPATSETITEPPGRT